MQTVLSKLSNEKAKKELETSTLGAAALSGVSLFVFWFLGIAGLALGARALLLTYHKGNLGRRDLLWYRLGAIFAVVAGLVSLGYGFSR